MSPSEWKMSAVKMLRSFARNNSEFTANEAFKWCFEQGLPKPTNQSSLGPVFKAALISESIVRPIGYVASDDPKAHGRPIVKYQSVICIFQDGGDPVRARLAEIATAFKSRRIDLQDALNQAYEFGLMGKR